MALISPIYLELRARSIAQYAGVGLDVARNVCRMALPWGKHSNTSLALACQEVDEVYAGEARSEQLPEPAREPTPHRAFPVPSDGLTLDDVIAMYTEDAED